MWFPSRPFVMLGISKLEQKALRTVFIKELEREFRADLQEIFP